MKKLASVVLLACLGLVLAHQASANLITNPGFETGDLTGWTSTLAVNGSALGVVTFEPHTGTYAAAFGATGPQLDYISQTFATVTGHNYAIEFFVLSVTKASSSLIVDFGGTTVLTLTDPAFVPGVQEYTRFAFIVPATGATTTLSFGGFAAVGELNLDDVLVEELPGSVRVPEGGSSALLLLIAVSALAAGNLSPAKLRRFRRT